LPSNGRESSVERRRVPCGGGRNLRRLLAKNRQRCYETDTPATESTIFGSAAVCAHRFPTNSA